MDKVSIVIPCYNVELFVEKCLDSIIQQSYKNLEIICINDGSSDGTAGLLAKYQRKDSRIHIITQQNKGLSETRNIGIDKATGEYLMFVDGDDWLEKDAVEKAFAKGYDLICFSYHRVFREWREPRIFNWSGVFGPGEVQRRIVGLIGRELQDPTQANSMVTVWGKIYLTDIIRKNNIKFISTAEIGSAEDALFNLHYLNFCIGKVKVIDSPFYNYRKDNSFSFTSTYKRQLFDQWKVLHKKIAEIVLGKGPDFEKAYHSRIALSLIGLGLNEIESKEDAKKITKRIAVILNQPEYILAYQNLEYKYLPPHWHLLFRLAKKRNATGVYLMMKLMSFLWKRKNR